MAAQAPLSSYIRPANGLYQMDGSQGGVMQPTSPYGTQPPHQMYPMTGMSPTGVMPTNPGASPSGVMPMNSGATGPSNFQNPYLMGGGSPSAAPAPMAGSGSSLGMPSAPTGVMPTNPGASNGVGPYHNYASPPIPTTQPANPGPMPTGTGPGSDNALRQWSQAEQQYNSYNNANSGNWTNGSMDYNKIFASDYGPDWASNPQRVQDAHTMQSMQDGTYTPGSLTSGYPSASTSSAPASGTGSMGPIGGALGSGSAAQAYGASTSGLGIGSTPAPSLGSAPTAPGALPLATNGNAGSVPGDGTGPIQYPSGGSQYSSSDIQNYLSSHPGMTDPQIASAMQQYGISPQQMSDAMGIPLSQVQSRYDAATTGGLGIGGSPAPAPTPAPYGGGGGGWHSVAHSHTPGTPGAGAPAPGGLQGAPSGVPGVPNNPSLGGYTQSPYLNQQAQSITDLVNRNLGINLAGINSQAVAAGGLGGSREGVAQGQAIGDANMGLASSLGSLYGTDYQNAMNRNLQQYQGDQSYGLGLGNLTLGNLNANNNYSLGQGQLGLQGQGQMLNFYNSQQQNDLARLLAGAQIYGAGTSGQWSPLQGASSIYGPYTGLGQTSTGTQSQGGGTMGALGGGIAGMVLGNNLFGGYGSNPANIPLDPMGNPY